MTKYETRLNRINAAAALQESDKVPVNSICQGYPFIETGHTMADALYDFNIVTEGYLRFAKKYDADAIFGHPYINGGMGPIYELVEPHTLRWAGMPGNIIDKNSIHQFIEFPLVDEDEFDLFDGDRSGWLFDKGLPKVAKLLEPIASWRISTMAPGYQLAVQLASLFNSPESKKMFETLSKIYEMNQKTLKAMADLDERLEKEAETPVLAKGGAAVPFDAYSDYYRGTLGAMEDMFNREDVIHRFRAKTLTQTLANIEAMGKRIPGKWVFMALHKGIDGFMSPSDYRKFYWEDLRTIIHHIIDNGMVPYIYTEGLYTSRLECLAEVPRGKVIYHFETCDMAKAKKILGNTACISGGFPVTLLQFGTKEQVIDEVKKLIDVCAPGGGYIFETSAAYDEAKQENVEAMYETARTYGSR